MQNDLKSNSINESAILRPRNGTALVFDPDPMTTLNNADLQDSDPTTNFTAAYITKTLFDINETNGTWTLVGPWVRIVDFEAPSTAPSTSITGEWTATRGNNAFNDVMTYFHIDQNQRYIQSLGYTGDRGIQNLSIEADSDGQDGADNSRFLRVNRLTFGHGGVDDNEDADIILHEYMHALLFDINNNYLPPSGDLGALSEGFADYWAGSYSYNTSNGPSFNPNWFATWDGHSTGMWGGRVLNKIGEIYDPTRTYIAHGRNGLDDEIWSAPLFQSLIDIINQGGTRQEMDRIVLESNFGLGSNVTMRQMARSVVNTADILYPNNIHAPALLNRFSNQNFVLRDVFVNASYSGSEDGTATNPFNTIQEGYDAVLPSGMLHITAGSYQIGNLILNRRMTIVAEGGILTIGY